MPDPGEALDPGEVLARVPLPLLQSLVEGGWLPFVGAGLSANAVDRSRRHPPLWKELGQAVGNQVTSYDGAGPLDAISAFAFQYERMALIELLRKLLLVDDAEPAAVHRAFCSIPFDQVATTNLDFLLERGYQELGRPCVVLLKETDLATHKSIPGPTLLKVHGDLNDGERAVLTEADYDGFLRRYPLLATYIVNLLITRSPVFIGYSLEDPDLRQLLVLVGDRLGGLRRRPWTVLVNPPMSKVQRFARRGVQVVGLQFPGSDNGEVLCALFTGLHQYWLSLAPAVGVVAVNDHPPLQRAEQVYFSVPDDLIATYRAAVFPVLEQKQLVPVAAHDVLTAPATVAALSEQLITDATAVVADLPRGAADTTQLARIRSYRRDGGGVIAVLPEDVDEGQLRTMVNTVVRRRAIRPEWPEDKIEALVAALDPLRVEPPTTVTIDMLRQSFHDMLEALQRALPPPDKCKPEPSDPPDAIIMSGERFALLTPHEGTRLLEAARLCEQPAETPEPNPETFSRLDVLLQLLVPRLRAHAICDRG